MIFIYKLIDPRDLSTRYVGKTNNPRVRLKNHCLHRFATSCSVWVQELRSLGLKPTMDILEEVPPERDWKAREAHWIFSLTEQGHKLYNSAKAGAGPPTPHIVSQSTREKLRQMFKGRPIPPEQRALISKSLTGKKQSPETIAKRMATIRANREARGIVNTYTPESRRLQKRLAGHPAKFSPEWKAKISESHKRRFASLSDEDKQRVRENMVAASKFPKKQRYVMPQERKQALSFIHKHKLSSLTHEEKLARMLPAFKANPNHQGKYAK